MGEYREMVDNSIKYKNSTYVLERCHQS